MISTDLMRQSKSQKFEKVLFEQNISQELNNRLLTIIEKPEERMRKPINNLHFLHSRERAGYTSHQPAFTRVSERKEH